MKTKGLTLKEAVESGYKFKHEYSSIWEEPFVESLELRAIDGYELQQLISSEWEIYKPERRVEISESEFHQLMMNYGIPHADVNLLKERLFSKAKG